MRPGPGLAEVLAGREVAATSDDELVAVMVGCRRLASWAQAAELAAVAELAARREPDEADGSSGRGGFEAVDEVALALSLTVGSAGEWVGLAEDLANRLPATRQALADGWIDVGRAWVVHNGLTGLDDDLARRIESQVLPKAGEQTSGWLRERIRRLVRKLDPDG